MEALAALERVGKDMNEDVGRPVVTGASSDVRGVAWVPLAASWGQTRGVSQQPGLGWCHLLLHRSELYSRPLCW